MHLLINGTSSFTGLYFLRDLILKGHKITVVSNLSFYQLSHKIRPLITLSPSDICVLSYSKFGEDVSSNPSFMYQFDAICCHGFHLSNYTSAAYSVLGSSSQSLEWLANISSFIRYSLRIPIIVTGTYFENHPQIDGSFPFSPYSEAKSLSCRLINLLFPYCKIFSYRLPNPFGPLQANKLAFSAINCWLNNTPITIKSPHAIRDNIPVDFLSDNYSSFISRTILNPPPESIFSPSYYIESTFHFVCRLRFILKVFPHFVPQINSFSASEDFSCLHGFTTLVPFYSRQEDHFWEKYMKSFSSF